MIEKLLELVTGKDDLERVAYREDINQLNAYLTKRAVWIPQRPRRYLDAADFTPEDLLELTREETERLAGNEFEPWVLEVEGKQTLPAFSSQKRMKVFTSTVSQQLGKVFGLACVQILLSNIVKNLDVDCVELNALSPKSWEIPIGSLRGRG